MTASTTAPAPVPSPVAFAGDLRSLLLAHPPSTVDVPRTGVADGTVDIATAAAMHNPSDVAGITRQLESFGYQRGAYTGWRDEAGNEVYLNLFQFADEKGTAGWLVGLQRGFGSSPDFDSGAAIDTVDAAKWYAFKPANGRRFMAALTWKGTLGVWVHLRLRDTETNLPLLQQVFQDQYARLP